MTCFDTDRPVNGQKFPGLTSALWSRVSRITSALAGFSDLGGEVFFFADAKTDNYNKRVGCVVRNFGLTNVVKKRIGIYWIISNFSFGTWHYEQTLTCHGQRPFRMHIFYRDVWERQIFWAHDIGCVSNNMSPDVWRQRCLSIYICLEWYS